MRYDDLSIGGFITHKHALSDGSDLTHPEELNSRCPVCSKHLNLDNAIITKEELNTDLRLEIIKDILKRQADEINQARREQGFELSYINLGE